MNPIIGPQYALILTQVSFSEATCQYVQSVMVSGAAVVSGSMRYAKPKHESMVIVRASENFMVNVPNFVPLMTAAE